MNNGQNEQWTLVTAGNAFPTTYYISNEASGRVIDDPASTSNVTNIEQWQLDGGADQKWTFVQIANGDYFIVNLASGMVLDDPQAETGNGVDIQQFQLSGAYNQEWTVTFQPNYSDVIQNAYSLQMLDDPNFSTSNGSPVDQFQPTGTANQQWDLLEPGNGFAGTYTVSNTYAGFMDSGGNSEGTGVNTVDRTLGVYQQWTFVPLIDGEDLIVNVGSGLVLDDPPSFSTNNVDQWQLNDGANQQWNIVPVNGGGGEVFTIFSANSGGQLESTGYPGAVYSDTSPAGSFDWILLPVSFFKRHLTYDRLVCRDSNQVPSTAASRTRLLRTPHRTARSSTETSTLRAGVASSSLRAAIWKIVKCGTVFIPIWFATSG